METAKLEIKVGIQILKPASEVFEAIVAPEKMANYFIEKGSGRMEAGKTLTWKFPEFEELSEIEVIKAERIKMFRFIGKSMERKC